MYDFSDLTDIIAKLRSPEGCPWDREQTHESLVKCLREESQEVAEAIRNQDMDNLCEELGDLLLQVMLHSQIAKEEGAFTIDDVVNGVTEKMIRRHPHVFGGATVNTTQEGLALWEEIKRREKEGKL